MLDDYKRICEINADSIPNWRDTDKNELCRKCIANENDPEIYNAYMAAILYKYWNLISKFHASCNGLVPPETVFDWLYDSITYALKHRRWEDPDSSIYNDVNGPDKVINRKMKCTRINLYQFTNRKKRKDEFGLISIDELTEKVNDTNFALIDRENSIDSLSICLSDYVQDLFSRGEYFMSHLVDAIAHGDVFEKPADGPVEFSVRKMSRFIRTMDNSYVAYFSKTYKADAAKVKESIRYIKSLDSKVIVCKIESSLYRMKHDECLMGLLRG